MGLFDEWQAFTSFVNSLLFGQDAPLAEEIPRWGFGELPQRLSSACLCLSCACLGLSEAVSGLSWHVLGSFRAVVEPVLGDMSWAALAMSCAILYLALAVVGVSWDIGQFWGQFWGPLLGPFSVMFRMLVPVRQPLKAVWHPLWRLLGFLGALSEGLVAQKYFKHKYKSHISTKRLFSLS